MRVFKAQTRETVCENATPGMTSRMESSAVAQGVKDLALPQHTGHGSGSDSIPGLGTSIGRGGQLGNKRWKESKEVAGVQWLKGSVTSAPPSRRRPRASLAPKEVAADRQP